MDQVFQKFDLYYNVPFLLLLLLLQDAYWRLYGSLAAYRMALQKESERNEDSDKDGKVLYDWIVATRFDVAWIRPLPPLRLFSKDAVWFGANVW